MVTDLTDGALTFGTLGVASPATAWQFQIRRVLHCCVEDGECRYEGNGTEALSDNPFAMKQIVLCSVFFFVACGSQTAREPEPTLTVSSNTVSAGDALTVQVLWDLPAGWVADDMRVSFGNPPGEVGSLIVQAAGDWRATFSWTRLVENGVVWSSSCVNGEYEGSLSVQASARDGTGNSSRGRGLIEQVRVACP